MNSFDSLREMAFTVERERLTIEVEDLAAPWSVITEMGYKEGTVCIPAFADGTASIYFSGGGGFIGGQVSETVRFAAQKMIEVAAAVRTHFSRTAAYPLPPVGTCTFYLRADKGLFSASAPEEDLYEDEHPLHPLFLAAQNIITAYRMQEAKPSQ